MTNHNSGRVNIHGDRSVRVDIRVCYGIQICSCFSGRSGHIDIHGVWILHYEGGHCRKFWVLVGIPRYWIIDYREKQWIQTTLWSHWQRWFRIDQPQARACPVHHSWQWCYTNVRQTWTCDISSSNYTFVLIWLTFWLVPALPSLHLSSLPLLFFQSLRLFCPPSQIATPAQE